jgi:cobalt/nickel transport system permease protein
MSDALLSPAVGGVMTAVSAGAIGFAVKKIAGNNFDEKKIPLMGVMGAFVFAGQMINFTIPMTGSSGHIGGGILLAALLGPFPALLTLASVLLIQCLFFADGGLLSLGSNVFNMGVCSCFFAYTLIFKPLVKTGLSATKITLASGTAVIVGLQAGAFAVVLETLLSGVTELPFGAFVLLMQPIHLAIGIVEGLVTAAVLVYVYRVRPEVLESSLRGEKIAKSVPVKKVLLTFGILAVVVSFVLSRFASEYPDGLEWSLINIVGNAEPEIADDAYNPTSGLVGSLITVILAGGIGLLIHATRGSRLSLEKRHQKD